MAAIAALTLTDSASVNHTYSPVEALPVAKWKDLSSGLHIGSPEASMGLRLPSQNAKTFKVTLKIVKPTMEVTSPSTDTGIQPAPTVAFKDFVNIELVMHERSDLTNRKDLLALARDFLGDAVVTAAVENFEKAY